MRINYIYVIKNKFMKKEMFSLLIIINLKKVFHLQKEFLQKIYLRNLNFKIISNVF